MIQPTDEGPRATDGPLDDGVSSRPHPPGLRPRAGMFLALSAGMLGLVAGYVIWGLPAGKVDTADLVSQINPAEGYTLPASFGDVGPDLVSAGAIDLEQFEQVHEASGTPLTPQQRAVLEGSSDAPIVINADNSRFLLNVFWALGLANRNPVLDSGPMVDQSNGQIDVFASTGGWTVGSRPVTEVYSSAPIVPLTAEEQAYVEEVASAVYRPCCDNSTGFPDCNHGMAMLGLLELVASQGATPDEMFEAAKYANAFWFQSQTLELATYFKAVEGTDFADVDGRRALGREFSSSSGFQRVHQQLADSGLLEPAGSSGASCGL